MAETAGDIMIRITAEAGQVKQEMDKIKTQVTQKVKDIDKAVNNGAKQSSENAKKGAENAANGVKQGTDKIKDEVKKTTDEVKKGTETSSNSSKEMGNSVTKAGNKVAEAGKKIKKALKTDAALAFAAVGAAATSFAKQCIDSAIASESAWKRFGAIIDQQGGDWSKQEKDVKGWARTFSNNMGYAVSDTREASLNLLQFGVDAKNLEPAMRGVAGLAARTGMSEAEASKVVISAMAGRGTQLKKLTGLSVDAYNKCQTEADQLRLLSDLYKQNEIALREHGETTEAQLTRVDNSWGRLKTEIGQSLMPAIKLMADVLWVVAEAFTSLPDPVKQFVSVLLLIGGAVSMVIGVAGMLAPGIIAIGEAVGGVAGVIAFLTGPIGITIAAIVGLVAVMYYLYNTNETVRNALNGFADWLKNGFATAWTSLSPIISALGKWLGEVASAVATSITPAFNTLVSTLQPVGQLFGELVTAVQRWWMAITGTDANGVSNGFNILASAGEILKAVIVFLANLFMNNLNTALKLIVIPIQAVVQGLVLLFNFASAVIGVFQTLFNLFTGNISLVDAVHQIFNTFSSALSGTLAGVILDEMANIANAFLNVDGILNAIQSGFTAVVDWFKSVLGIASPGIMAQTMAEEMGNIGQAILNGIGGILGAIGQFALQMLGSFVGAIMSIPGQIGGFFAQILVTVQTWLTQARTVAGMLVGLFVSYISQRFMSVVMSIRNIFMMVVNAIRTRLTQARTIAGTLATAIRTAIVTRIQSLVSRIRTFFQNIVSTIRSRLSNAVSTARQRAVEIYNNIINKIREIPSKVGEEVGKLKDIIRDKLVSAAKQMFSSAQSLVSNFLNGIAAHSPGKIQRTWLSEMSSLAKITSTHGAIAAKTTGSVAKNIVKSWEDNMTTLGVQFDTFNPLNVGMNVTTQNMDDIGVMGRNLGSTIGAVTSSTQYTNSIQNDSNTTIYNIDNVTFDTNTLDVNGKQMFYDVLNELSRQGV